MYKNTLELCILSLNHYSTYGVKIMCGILGVKFERKDDITVSFIKQLMIELKIRGTHSFGISFQHNGEYQEHKIVPETPTNCINIINYLLEQFINSSSYSFIFHNRYSTSGDYHDTTNNQPIVIDGFGAIAVNGVLSMATKKEMETEFNVKLSSENDSEIFLRKLEQDIPIKDTLEKYPACSYAGIVLKDNKITGIRNNKRPLYYGEFGNCKYFISTYDSIQRAKGMNNPICRIPPLTEVIL